MFGYGTKKTLSLLGRCVKNVKSNKWFYNVNWKNALNKAKQMIIGFSAVLPPNNIAWLCLLERRQRYEFMQNTQSREKWNKDAIRFVNSYNTVDQLWGSLLLKCA